METKLTPGTWNNAGEIDGEYFVEAHPDQNDGFAVAICHGPDGEANARAIEALPDLIQALDLVLAVATLEISRYHESLSYSKAIEALCKATGQVRIYQDGEWEVS